MCFVIMKHFINDNERFDCEPMCCFDYEDRAEEFLESKGLKCVGKRKYQSDYRRGRYDIPDMYYIKEIPYNDDNFEGFYKNNKDEKMWVGFEEQPPTPRLSSIANPPLMRGFQAKFEP